MTRQTHRLPRAFRTALSVLAMAVASSVWPTQVSAQYPEGCGYCYTHTVYLKKYHSFKILGFTHRCDNLGGCHTWWHLGRCGEYHQLCFLKPLGLVESAVAAGNSRDLRDILASSDDWDYDRAHRALSFTCSGYTVARYVLPQELAEVADLVATGRRGRGSVQKAEPGR